MSDSKRLTVLKALTAQLQTITVDNGYQHDLANSVFRGRNRFGEEEALPAIAILESLNPDRGPVDVGGDLRRKQKDKWTLLIQGWAKDDKANPSDAAHNLLGDVKKCLAAVADENSDPTVFMLNGLVGSLGIEPGTVRPPDDTSSRAYFWMRIELEIVERIGDPFDLT